MLAVPCPTHSRLPRPRVSVSSSISDNVINDSISPTPQSTSENGRMIHSVSRFSGGSSEAAEVNPSAPSPATSPASLAWSRPPAVYCSSKKNGTGSPPDIVTCFGSTDATAART